MHCPMTVINTGLMVRPHSAAMDQMLWAMPLAAICQVPKRATMLLTATFTSWKRPFSMPLGTAMRRILERRPAFQEKIHFFR